MPPACFSFLPWNQTAVSLPSHPAGPQGAGAPPQEGLLGKTTRSLASPRVSCGLRRAGSPTHPGGLAPSHLRCKTTCSWGPGAVLQKQPGFPATCDASVPHDVFLLTPEGRAESVPGVGTSSNQPETKRPLLRDVLWGEGTGHREKKALCSLLTPSDSQLHVGVRVRGSGGGADSLHPLSRAEHRTQVSVPAKEVRLANQAGGPESERPERQWPRRSAQIP